MGKTGKMLSSWFPCLNCFSTSATKGIPQMVGLDQVVAEDSKSVHVAQQTLAAWYTADINNDGQLTVKEVIKLCRSLNLRAPTKVIEAWFEKHDADSNGLLDYKEFTQFFKEIHSVPDLTKEFLIACEPEKPWVANVENTRMRPELLMSFLNKYSSPKHRIDASKATELILHYELVVQKLGFSWTTPASFESESSRSIEEDGLSYQGFLFLMTDPKFNGAADPVSLSTVTHDMTQPLSHYFISSSHNTYLLGNQLAGSSSTEAIKRALLLGVRVIELDAWDSPKGPIVTHGHTLVRPISFRECVAAIFEYGFKTSDYPVILTVENHCSYTNQGLQAKILREELRERLYIWREEINEGQQEKFCSDGPTEWMSPSELRGKVLVRDKPVNKKRRKKRNSVSSARDIGDSNTPQKESVERQVFPSNQEPMVVGDQNHSADDDLLLRKDTLNKDTCETLNPIENEVPQFDLGLNIADLEEDFETVLSADTILSGSPRSESGNPCSPCSALTATVDEDNTDNCTVVTLSSAPSPSSFAQDYTMDVPSSPGALDTVVSCFPESPEDSEQDDGPDECEMEQITEAPAPTAVDSINDLNTSGVHPSWLHLLYIQNRKLPLMHRDGQATLRDSLLVTSSSVVEAKMSKLVQPGFSAAAMNSYSRRHLVRVYPGGTRVTSSNYDPVPAWNAGCQLVALNYQTHDEGVWLGQGKFSQNGRCGYVLKPGAMLKATAIGLVRSPSASLQPQGQRRPSKVNQLLGGESEKRLTVQGVPSLPWDLDSRHVTPQVFRVTVISAHYLPKIRHPSLNAPGTEVNSFLMFSLRGVPADSQARQTTKTRGNRFNPTWEQTFEFEVSCKDLALLVVKLYCETPASAVGRIGPLLVGQVVYPLVVLREGFRVVPLFKANLEPLDFTYVFCKFEWLSK